MIILIKILIQPLSHISICSYIKYVPIHWKKNRIIYFLIIVSKGRFSSLLVHRKD